MKNKIYLLSNMRTVLPLLLTLFFSNDVLAQSNRLYWNHSEWIVVCDTTCKGTVYENDQKTLDKITSEFEKASSWLRDLKFPGPLVNSSGPNYLAVANIDEEAHGVYDTETFRINIDPNYLNKRSKARATHAHEIFHAIQAGYKNLQLDDLITNESFDWIFEGTADAVALAWIAENRTLENMSKVKNVPSAEFHIPLHNPESPYNTALFWYDAGLKFNSYPSQQIKYLDELLSAFKETEMNGLESVDHFFRKKLGEDKGLYDVYPWFIARHLKHHIFDGGLEEASFSFPGGEKEVTKTLSRKVRQIATDPINLKVNVPEGFFGSLRIEILDSFDDLHLIVDEGRYDSHKRDDKRNVADFSVSYDEEYFIRVSNIAKNAIDTKDNVSYKLKLTLTPETSCGKPRLSMLEMVGAEGLNENGMPPGKGVMRVSGSIYGTGEVCSDVVTGVPSFQSGAAGIFSLGNNVSFQLYTPGTNTIKIRGVDWPYHGGVGGWLPDSRYEIGVRLPDIKWEDIKEGETYPADVRIQYMHWQGELTETTSEGIPIRYLTGTKTQSWPTYSTHNGSVKIIRKRPSSDVNGGTNILVELVANNKYGKGTFTKSNLSVKTRSDGYIYSVEEGHESLDTIILYSKIDIHCISHKCRD